MSGPSVLFIGGSGIISAACVREAVEQGFDVTVLNRGETDKRPIPERVTRQQQDRGAVHAAGEGQRDRLLGGQGIEPALQGFVRRLNIARARRLDVRRSLPCDGIEESMSCRQLSVGLELLVGRCAGHLCEG